MAGIDLSGPRIFTESLMVDRCACFRGGNEGNRDTNWFNEETGTYEDPLIGGGDPPAIYAGKCQLWAQRSNAMYSGQETGGMDLQRSVWYVELPLDSPELHTEDVVVVIEVHDGGDSGLMDQRFRVNDIQSGTYVVSRIYSLIREERAPQ